MRTLAAFALLINAAMIMAQPGTLDPSFSDNGFLSTSYSETGTFAPNRPVATADGGHITAITKSTFYALLKFDAGGSQSGLRDNPTLQLDVRPFAPGLFHLHVNGAQINSQRTFIKN